MAELPSTTTSLFQTDQFKPPEVANFLREVETDWEKLIEFGNSAVVTEEQKPYLAQLEAMRNRTMQACKLLHEYVAFPTGSLGADAAEIVSDVPVEEFADDLDLELEACDTEFPPEYSDANLAASLLNFPALAARQEENKRQGLSLARPKKKAARPSS